MTVTIKRRRVESIEDFEKAFEKKSNTNGFKWPTRVGYKGRNIFTVRFLTDFDQWVNYEQYYDPATKRYVVATEENEESFSDRNIYPSVIHLASALDIENGEVIVLELKWTMVQEIKALRDKKGLPITDFDIELERRGEGKETTYRATYDGKAEMDLSRYEIPGNFKSWQDYLWTIVERLAGNDDDSSDDDLEDDNETDSEVEEKPVRKVALKRK